MPHNDKIKSIETPSVEISYDYVSCPIGWPQI